MIIGSRQQTNSGSSNGVIYVKDWDGKDAYHSSFFAQRYGITEKQIDTSNSTQLVSRQYVKCNLYVNANIPGQYYVELYFTETPVYQTKGYSMEAKYNVTVVNNKISSLELISQQSVSKKWGW